MNDGVGLEMLLARGVLANNFMKPEGPPQFENKEPEQTDKKIPSQESEKLNKLQAMIKEVNSWRDRLGKGVDEGIKETVAMYNVMGIPTSASCEGHFESESEHGYPVPWVEVEAPDKPKWRFEHEEEIYEQVAKKYGITVDQVLHAENDEAWKEATRLIIKQEETTEYKKWEEENEKLLVKVETLLQEFYHGRDATDEMRIIADRSVGGFRVHGGGKFYIPNNRKDQFRDKLTKEERDHIPEILKTTQQEMRNFTEFLRKKYTDNS